MPHFFAAKRKEVHIMNNTKKTAALLAAAMLFGVSATAFAEENIPAPSSGGSSTTSVRITADAQKDGAFLIVPQEITVLSGKAEEYGFTDSDEGVTMLDTLVTMHEMKYGDAFTTETVSSYLATGYNDTYNYYFISTSFGEPATASGYFINNKSVGDTVEKALVKGGDTVEYAFYSDTEMYMDCYTAFKPSNVTATAGTPVSLNMYMHKMITWYPNNELEPIADDYDFDAMTINLVNEDGSISAALTDENDKLIVPDENGIVTLTFDKPGTYIVTASGFIGDDYPIIAPYCIVTVEPQYTLENVNIKASATVKKAEGAEAATVILAVYKNGILTEIETKAVDGIVQFDTNIDNGSIVKMYIWDSLNGMKPVTSVN